VRIYFNVCPDFIENVEIIAEKIGHYLYPGTDLVSQNVFTQHL
jgi:hypothetical protein